ncbi:MAG: TIGR02206 family membrane protein [Planctomycetota bacterium]
MTTIAQGFQAFSPFHGFVILAVAAVIVAVVRFGLALQKRGRHGVLAVVIAVGGLLFWFIQQGYYVLVEQRWHDSLPLHVCDLAGLVGPIALLCGGPRLLRTTLYFWAAGLTIWGLLTPTLSRGPEHVTFWLFWINHGGVMLFAAYDCAVNGYRPRLGDWGMACLVTLAYVAIVMPFNLANDRWNYGYLGDVELMATTPLAILPPWPWRILGIEVLGALMLLGAWAPWAIVRAAHRRPDEAGAARVRGGVDSAASEKINAG